MPQVQPAQPAPQQPAHPAPETQTQGHASQQGITSTVTELTMAQQKAVEAIPTSIPPDIRKGLEDDFAAAVAKAEDKMKSNAKSRQQQTSGQTGQPTANPDRRNQQMAASYPNKVAFDAAMTQFAGPTGVQLDGATVKSGTDPVRRYTTNSATGVITSAPQPTSNVKMPTLAGAYPNRQQFDMSVNVWAGTQGVQLDGKIVKDGTEPMRKYYTHSTKGGVINLTGPTD